MTVNSKQGDHTSYLPTKTFLREKDLLLIISQEKHINHKPALSMKSRFYLLFLSSFPLPYERKKNVKGFEMRWKDYWVSSMENQAFCKHIFLD